MFYQDLNISNKIRWYYYGRLHFLVKQMIRVLSPQKWVIINNIHFWTSMLLSHPLPSMNIYILDDIV